MSDDYPAERYREAQVTLMHLYVFKKSLNGYDKACILKVLKMLKRLIPEEKT